MALVCNNCKQVVTDKIDAATGMPISVWVCEHCGEPNFVQPVETPVVPAPDIPPAFAPHPSSVSSAPVVPSVPDIPDEPLTEPPVAPPAPPAEPPKPAVPDLSIPEVPAPPSPKSDSQI